MESTQIEKRRIFFSLLFPFFMVAILWVVKGLEYYNQLDFGIYGILPRTAIGLRGIFLAPFIHADINHLVNNSVPIFFLGTALFYFYRPIAWRVLLLSFLLTSLYTWISARYNYHIGASGIVYALFSFLLLSGFIRRHLQLIAISFLVAFFYGSLIWGILPWNVKISWEGHFWGFFVGIILSIYYRKEGPQRKVYEWNEEEESLEASVPEPFEGWISNSSDQMSFYQYFMKKGLEDEDERTEVD